MADQSQMRGDDAHASFQARHMPFEAHSSGAPPLEAPHVRTPEQRDNIVVLLGVSCIAACCMCWFLEHLAFLLRPLVFAVGLSLILRPFVDFVSDGRYQKHKLRVWGSRLPWHPRVFTIPRLIALPVAIAMLMSIAGSFLWALYLSEQWITEKWADKQWSESFIARVNELADFTDKIALRLLKKNDFALKSWHTLQDECELTLKDEQFWTQFANNLFNYLGDIAICLFYVVFLLAPPRTPARLRSQIVRRIHAAVKRFVMIMVALSAVRAMLVGLLIYACGVPIELSVSIAVVSFWLFFIPNLGSFIASLIPLPLLILLPDLTTTQRWCGFFIPGFGSFLVGDILGPVWYRKGLDINEVVILLSLVFWFSVWGGVGAVLAVPIMCTLKICMEGIPHAGAHAVARMMAPSYTYQERQSEQTEGEWSDDEATPAVSVAGSVRGDGENESMGHLSRRTRRRQVNHPGWLRWGYTKMRESSWFKCMTGTEEGVRTRNRRNERESAFTDDENLETSLLRGENDTSL